MSQDVFISYSAADRSTAVAICQTLEGEGLGCWMAPRDVPPGQAWKKSIVEAIRGARVVILILSGHSNDSPQVRREVDIAFEAGHPIVPFRIEDVEMSEDLYYCIGSRHWLDASTPPLEPHFQSLTAAVARIVSPQVGTSWGPPDVDAVEPPAPAAPAEAPEPTRSEVIPLPSPASPPPAPPVTPAVAVEPLPSTQPTPSQAPDPRPDREPSGWRRSLFVAVAIAGAAVLLLLVLVGFVSFTSIFSESRAGSDSRPGVEAYEAKRYDEAFPLLLEAAEDGDAEAQVYVGRSYTYGHGVEKDDDEAFRWFQAASDQGHPGGFSGLGYHYSEGKAVEQDYSKALRWTRLAAQRGDARGQNNLGYILANGEGVEQDDAEAVRWYRRAADQGYAQAQVNLGFMYDVGRGVEEDDAEAVAWYRKAAEQGDARAQSNLGAMYSDGMGVEKDDEEAARWFRRAADQGNAGAQVNLGLMYADGEGVDASDEEAVYWYRKAAEQGDPTGQNNLGVMYGTGRGVARDDEEALRWYRLAAAQGYELAQKNISSLLGAWALPPLAPGVWQDLGEAERQAEIADLGSTDVDERLRRLRNQILRLRKYELGFWPDASLFEGEVGNVAERRGVVTYVHAGDRVILLDGKTALLHDFNRRVPLRLNSVQHAVSYIWLFTGAAQGSGGSRLKFIDDVEDLLWLPNASASQRQRAEDSILPLTASQAQDGGWKATGTLEHNGTLFKTDLRIRLDGEIDFENMEPEIVNLESSRERFNEECLRVRVKG